MLSRGWLTRWWRRCQVPIFGSHVTAEMSTSDQEFNFFSIEYNHLFDAHNLYGSCNTWSCLFWLGPSSFEMSILKTSHVAPSSGLEIPRPSGG